MAHLISASTSPVRRPAMATMQPTEGSERVTPSRMDLPAPTCPAPAAPALEPDSTTRLNTYWR